MKAIQVFGPKHLRLVDAPTPKPEAGQLLVRTEFLSICGSDMRTFRAAFPEEAYPFPIGTPSHECVGVVEESSFPAIPVGQRVIALSPESPGQGQQTGTGSEFVVTRPERVIPLPPEADPATYIMCQPVGTVLYGARRLGNILGQTVVILGQGVIGLTFTDLVARMGAGTIVAVDHHDYRLAKARQRGAAVTVNPYQEDVAATVKEVTGGKGAAVVIEAAGTPEAVNQLADLVRLYGTILLFGLPEEPTLELDYVKLMRRQATIIPSVSSSGDDPAQCIKDAVSLVAKGQLDVDWLITHRLPFSEAPRAYEMYESYQDEVIKVVMQV